MSEASGAAVCPFCRGQNSGFNRNEMLTSRKTQAWDEDGKFVVIPEGAMLIPTGDLRYLLDREGLTLQRAFMTGSKRIWRNVPIVEEIS